MGSSADLPLPDGRRRLALKIDVDTHDGYRRGVPALLDCLARHRCRATFFLTFGPDRMGLALLQLRHPRFVRKMVRSKAPSLYPMRTVLSGTLLPARPTAPAFPDVIRRMEGEGHEAAIHCWDHRRWQDWLDDLKPAAIATAFRRCHEAYCELTGHHPAGMGAAGWVTNPLSLRLQDDLGLSYASDLRHSLPCRLRLPDGVLSTPQLPANPACIEELLDGQPPDAEHLARALLQQAESDPSPVVVLTLHAEVEGGPFLPVLEHLLPRLQEHFHIDVMRVHADGIAGSRLPILDWYRIGLPGRAFPVSSARAG